MNAGTVIDVAIRFTTPVLGTSPKDPDTYADYIASKIAKRKDLTEEQSISLKAEEVAEAYNDIEAVEDRGWTGFHEENGEPYVYDYWIRGYLKTAFQALQETGDLAKIPAYKTKIDRFIFIAPRKLFFDLQGGVPGVIERPLRAMTARGPRVTLARSDTLPEGTTLGFTIECLKNKGIGLDEIREALDYGRYEGLGQWRSGGYGRFEVIHFGL